MKRKFQVLLMLLLLNVPVFSKQENSTFNKQQIDSILRKIEFYKEKFDYANAIDAVLKVKEYYEKTNNSNGVAYCNIKLAEINRHATLFEYSIDYLQQAKTIINKNSGKINDSILIYYYNRKAALASEYIQNPDSTLYYSNKALSLAKKIKNEKIELVSLLEIGFAYEIKNNLNKAIELYKTTIDKAILFNDNNVRNDATINLARAYTKINELDKALSICNERLAQIEDSEYLLKTILYSNLSAIYEKKGDINKAFELLKLRMNYTEKFYQQTEINKLQELNGKYHLKEKNSEIERTKERLEQISKNQILLTLFLILVIIGLMVLIYYSKKLQQSKNNLDLLLKENEFLLHEANHRINNNLQLIVILISEELKKLNGNEKLGVKKILSKVESIATLHRQLYKKNHKHEIEISNYLNEIKNNFSEILEEKNIVASFTIDTLKVNIDHGMYIGLLVTELLINSLKHAFINQNQGKINLHIQTKNNGYTFDFKDDGKTKNHKITKPVLIDKMCKQLKVDYSINTENGFHFSFTKTY